jgi:hypothetical protein
MGLHNTLTGEIQIEIVLDLIFYSKLMNFQQLLSTEFFGDKLPCYNVRNRNILCDRGIWNVRRPALRKNNVKKIAMV